MQADTIITADVANRLGAAGCPVDAGAGERLAEFLRLLCRWNRVFNLTGIRDPDTLVDRHLVESLRLAPYVRGARVGDVGSGAGLPGIPLAVVEPTRSFTLIESRAKRCSFLRHAAGRLGLDNVDVAECRAEDLEPDPPFDTLVARAVARPAGLIAHARALTGAGGRLVVLTSFELAAGYPDAAPDFVAVPAAADGLQSAIVVLDRPRA